VRDLPHLLAQVDLDRPVDAEGEQSTMPGPFGPMQRPTRNTTSRWYSGTIRTIVGSTRMTASTITPSRHRAMLLPSRKSICPTGENHIFASL
jgi:hypothetical protein